MGKKSKTKKPLPSPFLPPDIVMLNFEELGLGLGNVMMKLEGVEHPQPPSSPLKLLKADVKLVKIIHKYYKKIPYLRNFPNKTIHLVVKDTFSKGGDTHKFPGNFTEKYPP